MDSTNILVHELAKIEINMRFFKFISFERRVRTYDTPCNTQCPMAYFHYAYSRNCSARSSTYDVAYLLSALNIRNILQLFATDHKLCFHQAPLTIPFFGARATRVSHEWPQLPQRVTWGCFRFPMRPEIEFCNFYSTVLSCNCSTLNVLTESILYVYYSSYFYQAPCGRSVIPRTWHCQILHRSVTYHTAITCVECSHSVVMLHVIIIVVRIPTKYRSPMALFGPRAARESRKCPCYHSE